MRTTLLLATCIAAAAAAADPRITPPPVLVRRQDVDPALLGWVDAVNGQCESLPALPTASPPFPLGLQSHSHTSLDSDRRTCDYPATLSTSAALAQCCAPNTPCTFWQSCSADTLFASPSTSLFCDQGHCNTAVLVNTVGASTGVHYLGCWATSLGSSAFTIVRDIGGAGGSSAASMTSGGGSRGSSSPTTTADVTRLTGTVSRSSIGVTSSTAAAAATAGVGAKPLAGVVGVMAMGFGLM